jgi:hypothetical protein
MEGTNFYIDGKDRNFNLIRWVIEAADRDKNSRRLPSMKGLYCEAGDDGTVRFACTDGRRLHILDMDSGEGYRATSAAWEFADYAKSKGGNALFSIGKITKSGILLGGEIDGEFPNYRKILPATGAAEISGLDFKDGFNEAVFTVFSTGRNLNLDHLSGLGLVDGEWTYHDTVSKAKYPPVMFTNKSLASVYLTAVFAPRESGAALAMAEKWKEAAKAKEPEAVKFHKEMDPESPEAADFMESVNALVSPEALKAAIEAEKPETADPEEDGGNGAAMKRARACLEAENNALFLEARRKELETAPYDTAGRKAAEAEVAEVCRKFGFTHDYANALYFLEMSAGDFGKHPDNGELQGIFSSDLRLLAHSDAPQGGG